MFFAYYIWINFGKYLYAETPAYENTANQATYISSYGHFKDLI